MKKKISVIFAALFILSACNSSNKVNEKNVAKKVTIIDSQTDRWIKDDFIKPSKDSASNKNDQKQQNVTNAEPKKQELQNNNTKENSVPVSKEQNPNAVVSNPSQLAEVKSPPQPLPTEEKKENKDNQAQTQTYQAKDNYIQTTNKQRPEIPTKYPVEYWGEVEDKIVFLCNNERAKVGDSPLSAIDTLREVARYKSDEMLQYNYFEHVSPITGFQPWDLAGTYGWHSSAYGENIWMVQADGLDPNNAAQMQAYRASITAEKIVTDWMNSPGHKENILNKNFTKIGVGLAFSSCGRSYATQEFSN